MRIILAILICVFALTGTAIAQTKVEPPTFASQAEEDRFQHLLSELRCVMCQNQSLADSDAQIAVELRREVLDLMRQGRNDEEVKAYLVQRYGEFVLYRPVVNRRNIFLWLGPFGMLVLSVGVLALWRRGQRAQVTGTQREDGDQKDVNW